MHNLFQCKHCEGKGGKPAPDYLQQKYLDLASNDPVIQWSKICSKCYETKIPVKKFNQSENEFCCQKCFGKGYDIFKFKSWSNKNQQLQQCNGCREKYSIKEIFSRKRELYQLKLCNQCKGLGYIYTGYGVIIRW